MLTIVFVVIFGAILLGVVVYKTMFSGGRKNQSGRGEVNAQQQEPKTGRGTGVGDN